ncbi:MAG TPA: nucleotidyltransferase family protein [Gemmatimonadaceae bacterium]|nr:nucleotidyltransferase family protein [Gemmatimonadaceae bacterium]
MKQSPHLNGARRSLLLALATCCRRDAERGLAGLAPRLRDRAWREALLALSDQHALTALVLSTLERSAVMAGLPDEARASLRDLLKRYRRRALVFEVERDRVLGALRRGGIDSVLLKGGALAGTVYREPAERFYGDVDVLLPIEQLESAAQLLEPLGYAIPLSEMEVEGFRAHHFHLRLENGRGGIVELHWGLARPHTPFRLDAEAFMAQAIQRRNGGGTAVRMPRAEHMLLHIVLQSVQEGFTRLTRLVDVDRIVAATSDIDWDDTVRRARDGHLGAALALSLQLTSRLLGTAIPREAIASACPSRSSRLHLALLRPARAMERLNQPIGLASEELLRLWLLPRRQRRQGFLRLLSPNSDDPLRWIWEHNESPPEAPPSITRGLVSAGKVVALQVGTYARAVGAMTTAQGRKELKLWA